MGDIQQIIVDGETIYLKKGFFGWNVVAPYKDETGKINWFNFIVGGWGSLIWMLFILLLLGTFYLAWREMANQAVACFSRNQTIIKNVVDYSSNINWNGIDLSSFN